MTHTFHGTSAFAAAAGRDLGHGPWFTMTQQRIDDFADVTEDWQWIHVDADRAAASELGTTLAHGYLTLSLVPRLSFDIFDFAGIGRAINYGVDRVRFPAPVRPGDRIRAHASVVDTTPSAGGVLGRVRYTIEIDRSERPACVVEALMLVLPPADEATADA